MDQAAQEWMAKAEDDLRDARLLLGSGSATNAAYHAQQAVEKMLKARIQETTASPPERSHDLERLARDGGVWQAMSPQDQARLRPLSACAVGPRYPGGQAPTPEEAGELVADAEVLCQWLRRRLT